MLWGSCRGDVVGFFRIRRVGVRFAVWKEVREFADVVVELEVGEAGGLMEGLVDVFLVLSEVASNLVLRFGLVFDDA